MFKVISFLLATYVALSFTMVNTLGINGFFGEFFTDYTFLKFLIYFILTGHITILCMSLSFHRYHTHKGVVLNRWIDLPMQALLWLVTSLSKIDWVSVHIYHHAHSDQAKDPHSPLRKGLWHALFLGVFDFTTAKAWPEVEKIKKTLPANKFELFMYRNSLLGPFILTFFLIVLFGPVWGMVLSGLNFLISPIFAIGGVNALAHWWGYRNHVTTDNSRNLGFIFPMNFMVAGELDHNNHHAHMKSCSFRHRAFEFDIGYCYIKVLSWFKLAKIKNAYTPASLKQEISKKISELIEKDYRFKKRCEELALELNTNYQELKARMECYYRGEKVKLEDSVREFMAEVERTLKANQRLKLTYG